MSNKTMLDLRAALFAALAETRDTSKPLDVARMNATVAIAREITSTARIEIDYMRQVGDKNGSGFVQIEKGDESATEATQSSLTRTGVQSISNPAHGIRKITHVMR